ncbi:radical SAM protein [Anaeromicropila herbilytica]|uniref:Radical SAM protein n=1 Tax=Anaeromicropila herbilytica TaxID=2785025 RepID=A0A7R7EIJ0_9FIRM|nr:radical SAM protein [Anaeromicropila herbilytica]BCN29087.1 radical SAM protein [Anaeromicropila herbilytica]
MQNLNQYIKKIDRVEYVITDACTSRCKHCSEGDLKGKHRLDADIAANALIELAQYYEIHSIMTFGGEALLFPEKVAKIHTVARQCKIEQRQLITNGCFSKDMKRIEEVACMLEESGVNDILLSVDCFHAEHLPLEWVRCFAVALTKHYSGKLMLQPSWVRNPDEDNRYNQKTRECLAYFDDLAIEQARGDIIFPQGNATKYLSEYFEKKPINLDFRCGDALYSTDLLGINEISINSNGDVIPCSFPIGNIYKDNIIDIIRGYNPYQDPLTKSLVEKGIYGLIEQAEKQGIHLNIEQYYSPCEICHEICREIT